LVDEIWLSYDADKNGRLDKREAKRFIQDTLRRVGEGDYILRDDFGKIFSIWDKDKSGTIEKPEMTEFFKKCLAKAYGAS